MGKILAFFLLAGLTGGPWSALAIMIAFYWILDRSTLRYIPGPWKLFRRFMERRRLENVLAGNPHDFRSELELGRLLLEAGRPVAALPHLEKAAGAYTTDASVQVLRAVARVGAGQRDSGAAEVEQLMTANPRLRFGEPWLDAGAMLLKAGDAPRARAMIQNFLQAQPSNVKGLYLLGRAQKKCGELDVAKASMAKAWNEYATNPAFKQREGRVWAYRANPLRPVMYAGAVFAVLGVLGFMVKK